MANFIITVGRRQLRFIVFSSVQPRVSLTYSRGRWSKKADDYLSFFLASLQQAAAVLMWWWHSSHQWLRVILSRKQHNNSNDEITLAFENLRCLWGLSTVCARKMHACKSINIWRTCAGHCWSTPATKGEGGALMRWLCAVRPRRWCTHRSSSFMMRPFMCC